MSHYVYDIVLHSSEHARVRTIAMCSAPQKVINCVVDLVKCLRLAAKEAGSATCIIYTRSDSVQVI